MAADRKISFFLRLIGGIDLFALVAVAMPFAWMEAIHARLGLGTLPAVPVVEYLARASSIFYALHAALALFLSTDVPRYRPVIAFLAWAALVHAALLLWTDWRAGMPTWWAVAEPGGVAAEGLLFLGLLNSDRFNSRQSPRTERSDAEDRLVSAAEVAPRSTFS